MEPPLCGTWVIRSTVYVGAPPSGKYWIFSQGYMGPKCAACGAGEWSLDGMAPCRKCDDCSTRGGVLSQGPGRVLQSDSSHPRASPNCTATADTGCVLPRSCQLGLTFSTSGREPCTYVWGIHVGNRVESVRTGARVFVYSCIRVFVYSCIRVFVYSWCTGSGGFMRAKDRQGCKRGRYVLCRLVLSGVRANCSDNNLSSPHIVLAIHATPVVEFTHPSQSVQGML